MKIKSLKISELIVGNVYSVLGLGGGDVIEGTYQGCDYEANHLFFEVDGKKVIVAMGAKEWDEPKNFVCHFSADTLELIFDEKELRSHGDIDDPQNTPDILVERMKAKLTKLGKFMHADSIKYVEDHKTEMFVVARGDKKLIIIAHGNAIDGGYITIEG